MTRHQLCIDIGESWRDIGEKLARDIFRGWWHFVKRGIILIQKFMIEAFVYDFSGAFLDFTDVDEHSGDRIASAAENKIGGAIASGAILRARLRTKCGQIFAVGPA